MASSSEIPVEPAPKKKKRRGVHQRRRQKFEKEGLEDVKSALAASMEDSDSDALEEVCHDAAAHIAKAGKRESAVQSSAQYKDCEQKLGAAHILLAQRRARKELAAEVASGSDEQALRQAISIAREAGLDDSAEMAEAFATYWFGEAPIMPGIPDSEDNPFYDEQDQDVQIPVALLPEVSTPAPQNVFVLGEAPDNCWIFDDPLVCVFGLFKSGTKLLAEYLRQSFAVRVTPAEGKHPVDGEVVLPGCKLWKHRVPFSPLPLERETRPACVLICVREVRSWLCALSEHAYTIRKAQGGRRKKHNIGWMLQDITIQDEVSGNVYPFAGVPELYSAYITGYFATYISTDLPAVVVKYEDLLAQPMSVLNELERLGLRRNVSDARIIDENVGSSGRDRTALMEQEKQVSQRFSHEQLVRIGGGLSDDCVENLRSLGYV